MFSSIQIIDVRVQKNAPIPLVKGREHTRVATLIEQTDACSTCFITARMPALSTAGFNKATPGRIRERFYRLPPAVDSL
jgi:hypothetical protein